MPVIVGRSHGDVRARGRDRRARRPAVLNDLDVVPHDGATAIVRPSGAGKSTLLRLLNRLADPQRGIVRYRGRDVRKLDVLALRRDVGLVPQLPALLPGSVADNLHYAAQLAGRAANVPDLLAAAGLPAGLAERDAAQLWVGEQQRVMLARALATGPGVLLLDEPDATLDERSRAIVERTLLELRAQTELSLVVVTHDRAQAERLAERVVTLDGVASAQVARGLTAVGYVVKIVFDQARLVFVVALLGAMTIIGALSAGHRAAAVPGAFWPLLIALALVAVATLGLVVALGVFAAEPRNLVPVEGMVIGNSMTAAAVALNRLGDDVRRAFPSHA